jgi:hypothetical protein
MILIEGLYPSDSVLFCKTLIRLVLFSNQLTTQRLIVHDNPFLLINAGTAGCC